MGSSLILKTPKNNKVKGLKNNNNLFTSTPFQPNPDYEHCGYFMVTGFDF
jgi:hypothetical protein